MPTPSSSEGAIAPTSREELSGNNVSIANGANGNLTFNSSSGPNVVLTRTNPAAPYVATAGIYSVAAQVYPATAMTPGGLYYVNLHLDRHGYDAITAADVVAATAADPQPTRTVYGTWYLPSGTASGGGDGGDITVNVQNADGVQTINFKLSDFFIQRIS